ncbi:MAG TPA: hypothetical protein GXX77_06980, partial [Candidatus Cloacimonetes bacterium]|nr:hypothetical protein [Candidatus Cloacimonadota bacterium]
MQLETGSVLRDYEIEKFLGKGGMGTVYLAKDSFLDRSVAIKELSPLLTADAECRRKLKMHHKRKFKLHQIKLSIISPLNLRVRRNHE